MDPARCSGERSGNSGTYATEMNETLRFEEEIQSLMRDNNIISQGLDCASPENAGGSSFTALLGLHPSQAVELLHELDPGSSSGFRLPICSPTFPSNVALIERATRFSVFAGCEDSPEGSSAFPSDDGDHSPNNKSDPPDSDLKPQRLVKRKETEKSSKAKAASKKGKSVAGDDGEGSPPANLDGEKLPYVHVRARRGQATDSHSLAERARREKINARMKLLQELVPGCSKISGTALVLDEIINHVQLLQRQVEMLSMRLAAVNPRIDFTGLDNLFSSECGRVGASGNYAGWADGSYNGVIRRSNNNNLDDDQQQIWQQQQQQQETAGWERDETETQQLHHHHHYVFISGNTNNGSPPGTSLFRYDSSASALPQLKSEM